MVDKKTLQVIRNLIAKGQLNEALNQLVDMAANEQLNEYNDLILLSAKYRALEKLELDNRISFENYQKGTHKLLRTLITMVDDLDKGFPTTTTKPDTSSSLTEIFKASIARAKVIEILLATERGLTIKEIQQLSGLKNRKYIIVTLNELIAEGIVERFKETGDSLNRIVEGRKGIVKKWL